MDRPESGNHLAGDSVWRLTGSGKSREESGSSQTRTNALRGHAVDPATFEAADPIVDKIADAVDAALLSDQLADLRHLLQDLGKALGQRYSAELNVSIQIFDRELQRAVPLLNTGLSTTDDGPPYRAWGDSTPQRYLVGNEIQVVPHDRCPRCWDEWGFKFENPVCEHCGTTLGQDCKVLLDSDVCPNCERGKVSMTNPTCDQCGTKVDLDFVAWG